MFGDPLKCCFSISLLKCSQEIERINEKLDKIDQFSHGNLRMLCDQEENIAKVQKRIDGQIKPMLQKGVKQDPAFKSFLDTLGNISSSVDSTLGKIASLRVEFFSEDKATEKPDKTLDPGCYELVGCKTSENGNSYTFLSIDLDPEEQRQIYTDAFPAVVPTFDQLSESFRWHVEKEGSNFASTLASLGYSFDWDTGELSFPDCELLNYLSRKVVSEAPAPESHPLKGFEVQRSEGIAEDLEFIDAKLEGKTILSSGVEFTHDHIIHIIREIEIRLQGDFEEHREIIFTMVRPVREFIDSASRKLETLPNGPTKNGIKTDIKQLATLTSSFLDINSVRTLGEIMSYFDIFGYDAVSGDHDLFLKKFNDTYSDALLTQENRLDYLFMLIGINQTIHQNAFPKSFSDYGFDSNLKQKMSGYSKELELLGIKIASDPGKGLSLKYEGRVLTVQDNPIKIMMLLRIKMGLV